MGIYLGSINIIICCSCVLFLQGIHIEYNKTFERPRGAQGGGRGPDDGDHVRCTWASMQNDLHKALNL